MAKAEQYTVTLDARGFLRFVAATASELKISKYPYVEILIDPAGKRVAMRLSKKESLGSFRLLDHDGRYLVFAKGALNAAGIKPTPGQLQLHVQDDLLVILSPKSKAEGAWQAFACRNSAGIPMASLDARGTLIFDRNCTSAIDMVAMPTVTAEYNRKNNSFLLTFSKKDGQLNVRSIGSHANVSFMGTLTSNGLALPTSRVRMACKLKKKTIEFTVVSQ